MSPSRKCSGSTSLESDAPPKRLKLGPLKGWGIERDGVNMTPGTEVQPQPGRVSRHRRPPHWSPSTAEGTPHSRRAAGSSDLLDSVAYRAFFLHKYLPCFQGRGGTPPLYSDLSLFDPDSLHQLCLRSDEGAGIQHFLEDKPAMAAFRNLYILELGFNNTMTVADLHACISPFPAIRELTLQNEEKGWGFSRKTAPQMCGKG
ncbi:hypothetical protein B0H13DRAFT_1904603 [Mycena leptocephala]|nr:hypothetical protein B0H13DRAFT_1904603 [Mycena leptocephala]